MLRYVALLAIIGVAAAEFECCSTEDRREVQQLWADVWSAEYTGRRIQVARAVFEDLLEREPDARNLFKGVNVDDMDSPEFQAHCIRVVNGLDTVIGLFDDTATLILHLDHLGGQHAAREGVKGEHFDVIGRSFLKVMPQVSGCFNRDAWSRCFEGIARRISSHL